MDIILLNLLVKVDVHACQIVKILIEVITVNISNDYITIHENSVREYHRKSWNPVHLHKYFEQIYLFAVK